jgi:D-beta-D-heptose 7-phosphate kinase / D-beta-D-heptose 1-phosphate adenosyltransferase
MSADLIGLVERLGQPRILVLGDVMLDRYIWGDAERISQEAPVILLHADRREERLGGASSVATLLRALGAQVSLIGVTGADADAPRIRKILGDLDIDHEGVRTDPSRPSTVKERYIGRAQHRHPQQIVRIDYERREPVSDAIGAELMQSLDSKLAHADIVLISDYDKGVCTPPVLAQAIKKSRQRGLRVIVDPMRGVDYAKYRGCSAMTPNRLEAGLATGKTLQTNQSALEAGARLREDLGMEAAIVTLDKDGMALVHEDGRRQVFPTRPRQVYDITGAGDMVLAMMGMAIAAGADYDPAIRLANVAGGLEVERIGVAAIARDEILSDLRGTQLADNRKSLTGDCLLAELQHRRALGQRIAFTNGCFDLLHAGHVLYLQEARAQADVLLVAINSDRTVRQLKGSSRPVNSERARSLVLSSLQAVDLVTVFDEATPVELIRAIRPDVLVKGGDYTKQQVVGASFVESYGGRVHIARFQEGFSTTRLLNQLGAA